MVKQEQHTFPPLQTSSNHQRRRPAAEMATKLRLHQPVYSSMAALHRSSDLLCAPDSFATATTTTTTAATIGSSSRSAGILDSSFLKTAQATSLESTFAEIDRSTDHVPCFSWYIYEP